MQWTVGDVKVTTGVKGVGDFFSKSLRGSVTGESAIKSEYTGSGIGAYLQAYPADRHRRLGRKCGSG